jgi:hypothetical protein
MGPLTMVWCVVCIARPRPGEERGEETLHIFSSPERAQAFAAADADRAHVLYDYAVDCPERHEGRAQ